MQCALYPESRTIGLINFYAKLGFDWWFPFELSWNPPMQNPVPCFGVNLIRLLYSVRIRTACWLFDVVLVFDITLRGKLKASQVLRLHPLQVQWLGWRALPGHLAKRPPRHRPKRCPRHPQPKRQRHQRPPRHHPGCPRLAAITPYNQAVVYVCLCVVPRIFDVECQATGVSEGQTLHSINYFHESFLIQDDWKTQLIPGHIFDDNIWHSRTTAQPRKNWRNVRSEKARMPWAAPGQSIIGRRGRKSDG